MRRLLFLLAACGSSTKPAAPDAPATADAGPDVAPDVDASSGFGDLGGMCGVLVVGRSDEPVAGDRPRHVHVRTRVHGSARIARC